MPGINPFQRLIRYVIRLTQRIRFFLTGRELLVFYLSRLASRKGRNKVNKTGFEFTHISHIRLTFA